MTKKTTKQNPKNNKIIWQIEKRNIDDLKPHPKNPRHFTEKGLKDLENSINSIGFASPININQNGTILGGHARILKLQEMGHKEIDVYVPDRILTPEQEDEVIIRLNANTAGEWDFEKLANEFDIGDLSEWGLEIPGMEEETEETIGDDEVPEELVKTITIKGDLYELGKHRVLCGDSTMIDNVEKLMDGKKADMVFTDPPYGVDYEGINNDSRSGLENLLDQVFSNYKTFSKLGASIYVFHSDRCADIFHQVFRKYCHFSSMIIWVKPALVLSQTDYQSKHEPCIYGWFEGETHLWYSDRKQTSIWEYGKENVEGHTTPKPVELIINALNNSSKKEQIISDLFLGSGSTLIACEKTKRICYGMELDPKYCDVIVKRYIQFCEANSIKPIVKRNGKDCLKEFKNAE
jgi:DNA modification methylase